MAEPEFKKRINAWAWIDQDNALHFDLPEMLKELGVVDSPQNRAMLTEMCDEYLRKELPGATVIHTD